MTEGRRVTELVLVGGGHTHVQVLKAFAMDPPRGVRTTVVVDTPVAVYSGMVPGLVAGQYAASELEIDVLPLARLLGARFVVAPAVGVDTERHLVELEDRPPIRYDVVSFDVGSTVAGLDTDGVREHALSTRPIGSFARRVEERLGRWTDGEGTVRAVVVGGGAGGVELAFTLEHRIGSSGREADVTLIEAGEAILPGYSGRIAAKATELARSRGIRVVTGQPVEAVDASGVVRGGERIPAELVVWVAGAAPHPFLSDAGLPTGEGGFLATRPTLQVEGHDDVFAAGDCATLTDHRWTPKAGVYAVRQGPVLTTNLRRAVTGRGRLRRYRPQRDFLTLLNLGDGRAIGSKWGLTFAGRWVFRLKDWIDRRFMERFQVLRSDDRVATEFSKLAGMRGAMDMVCGGCAAKLGQGTLERALARVEGSGRPDGVELGIAEGDDAAAYRVAAGARVVSSVDQFRAFTDDPYLVGRVGAVNAASDVFAKGVRPEFAQALVALPDGTTDDEREETLVQVLAGARRAFDEMGVTLVGGHTTTAAELLVGFQVEAVAGDEVELLSIDRLRPGSELVLTKALGTGVLFHADMKGRLRGPWFEAALRSMLMPNSEAADIARRAGATAATDVTGFGLAQHLGSMLRASGVSAAIDVAALPALPGAAVLLQRGLRSTFHEENARAARGIDFAPDARSHEKVPLLFDPQTSGGLLFGVAVGQGDDAVAALRGAGYPAAAVIGRVAEDHLPRLRVAVGRPPD